MEETRQGLWQGETSSSLTLPSSSRTTQPSSRKKTEEMASGIVALALEANPKQRLGEDIQHIIVGTSVPGKTIMGKDRRLLGLSKNGPLIISTMALYLDSRSDRA